jgi:hypothetical protein
MFKLLDIAKREGKKKEEEKAQAREEKSSPHFGPRIEPNKQRNLKSNFGEMGVYTRSGISAQNPYFKLILLGVLCLFIYFIWMDIALYVNLQRWSPPALESATSTSSGGRDG